jgi:uncharacterized Ntn-hydrolase superfamily protein
MRPRSRRRPAFLPLLACLALSLAPAPGRAKDETGTFSIVAYDSVTQELGVAVESKYFAVGFTVPWAEANAGAVATQATVNPSFGPRALALLRTGLPAEQVLRALAASDTLWDSRQVGIVDARGHAVTWTGKGCLDWAGGQAGDGFACQGNILAGPAVVANMAKAFRETKGELAERLVSALEAAQAAGGDRRGQQAAALIVVRPSITNPEFNVRYVDLHVEDSKAPIKELRRLWQIFQGFHGANEHLIYAEQYEASGQPQLAQMEREQVAQSLQRALARGENDPSTLNGLAWACAIHDMDLPSALKAIQRAASIEPRNVDILDTEAEIYFRMGNSAKAIEVESRAVQIDPKSVYLKDQIARFKAGPK